MKTLYVSDLDGTLLNNGSFISDRSAEILSDLAADGCLFTVATARTPATVVPLMERVASHVPYVVLTGAALFDPTTMTYLNRRTMPDSDCLRLSALFYESGVNPFVYSFDSDNMLIVYHSPQMTPQERDFYEARAHLRLKLFTFEKSAIADREHILYFAIGKSSVITSLAARIEATGKFSVSCYPDIFTPDIHLLEVFIAGVSKAEAILQLKNQLGCDRLVAFGDNLNDLPMLNAADTGIAVNNALSSVKEAADLIIGPNYDDSVARFIRDDFYGLR